MAWIGKARWQEISPLLDTLLGLEGEERAGRLAQVRCTDEALADELESLLAQRSTLQRKAFLEGSALPNAPEPTLEGRTIGSYTLERPIGHGGMGAVWLARRSDGRFEAKVAIKLLNLALLGRSGAPRFQREGSILARLAHPNIARLLDAGVTAEGQPYLVLEYVEGESIDQYCDARALGVAARVALFLDVLAAVTEAHRNLILHRDLKPSNILVTASGQVKLLDFGIAKLLEDEAQSAGSTELTRLGGFAFTPEYAAPEQVEGDNLTVATDVYALGVLLYVLLSGGHPTAANARTSVERLRALLEVEPEAMSVAAAHVDTAVAAQRGCSPRELAHSLRGDLDNIVAKALKKLPDERFSAVVALAQDLRDHLAGRPVSAVADNPWYRARKFIVRNRAPVGAVTLIALALIVGSGVALWQANVARAEADRAHEINAFVLSLFRSAGPSDTFGSDVRAVDLLQRARQRIESELAGRQDLQVELLTTVAQSLYQLTAHAEARSAFERALELDGRGRRASLSSSGQQAALQLADLLVIMGDYTSAANLIDRLEPMLRARAPSQGLVDLLMQRSLLFYNTGRRTEAIAPAEEAVRVMKTLPDVPRLAQAETILSLARAQYQADRNQAALDSATAALALFEPLEGLGKTEAIRTRALIARILRDLNRDDEAAARLGAELPRIRSAFGDQSHDYAVNLSEYAVLQIDRGELEIAASSIEEALRIATEKGMGRRNLALWHMSAGVADLQLREFAAAREHFAASQDQASYQDVPQLNVDLRNELFLWQAQVLDGGRDPPPVHLRAIIENGPESVRLGETIYVGAQCALGWQQLLGLQARSAIGHFDAAAKMFDKVGRHYAFLTPWCMTGLGRALLATSELDRAQEILDQSLQLQQQKQVRMTPSRAETLVALAELRLRRGDVQQALSAASEADAFWQAFRPTNRLAGEAAIWHGRALIRAGQSREGESALQRGRAALSGAPLATQRELVRYLSTSNVGHR